MTVLKCKRCGGDLIITPGVNIATCDSCFSQQTIPDTTDQNQKKINNFNRANDLRAQCEFDRALERYESIVEQYPQEAEAYWGILLCKLGIEYVDDPATGKKVPTCHRSTYTSILDDRDYKQAIQYASPEAKKIYEAEAQVLEHIRQGIVDLSSQEEPYDIFISYKESDDVTGSRTLDSDLAQDLYEAFTKAGYKVFFSRITLKNKLGRDYEPIIFSALHTAKVMLLVVADKAHFDAVWVKNEWSRYLSLIHAGEEKYLIPCIKGVNPADMPDVLKKCQAQDLGVVGATRDLVNNVEKFFSDKGLSTVSEEAVKDALKQMEGESVNSLFDRASIFLGDGEFNKAKEYYNKALDKAPKDARGYWGLLMVEKECRSSRELAELVVDLSDSVNYRRAIQYADAKQREAYLAVKNSCDENVRAAQEKRSAKERRHAAYIKQVEQLKAKYSNEEGDEFRAFRKSVGETEALRKKYESMGEIKPFSGKIMLIYLLVLLLSILSVYFHGELLLILIALGFFGGSAVLFKKTMTKGRPIPSAVVVAVLAYAAAKSFPETNTVAGYVSIACIVISAALCIAYGRRIAVKRNKENTAQQIMQKIETVGQEALKLEFAAAAELSGINRRNKEFMREWCWPSDVTSDLWFTSMACSFNRKLGKENQYDDCAVPGKYYSNLLIEYIPDSARQDVCRLLGQGVGMSAAAIAPALRELPKKIPCGKMDKFETEDIIAACTAAGVKGRTMKADGTWEPWKS